ncbi:MAG: DUF561 domain-containing protein [Bacilli bacterium]|nr:DUF561 domain-containing protein [Bacilli bacterium]
MNIQKQLGIQYPIIQGAMARIADATLAAAVSNAGGLGIIAGGGLSKEELKSEIRKCKELTSKPFGVNIMLMASNKDEQAKLLIEEKVAVVTTGAGSPEAYITMWKEAGIKIIPVIASVKHAKKMEALGVDAIIAEGTEAGGHIGNTTTMCLIPQIVDAVSIPVIAAGGIADGRGMRAVEVLGASGVQIGTRFLATEECNIAQAYKEEVIKANDTDTRVLGLSIASPIRNLKNEMTENYLQLEHTGASKEELDKLTFGALKKAVEGDIINGSMMSGQIAGMIHEIKPVREVIEDLMLQYETVKREI